MKVLSCCSGFIYFVLLFVFVMLSGRSVKLNAFRLVHIIPSQGVERYAVASLGDDIFVACESGQCIEVYDARTFVLQRHLRVRGLASASYGLAACVHNNCLYASNYQNCIIHRVDLSHSSAVKNWSVARKPAGLSVNKAHNVVVTCYGADKLQEYTTNGVPVREINLSQADVTHPWHAIQLSTGDYVISQFKSPGVVSVVRVDGQVVRTYDFSQAPNVGPMKNPGSLAVTKNGAILVADDDNHRILSLSSSLSYYAQVLPVSDGIQYPCSLCLDESRDRLYVSEHGKSRLLVFKSTPAE